ncbi:hypothetical protein EK904_003220 [Melospiza melodia maxima]|nr:hypothetical protein EK904_003220 [Melospiza melodia maxima]
MPIEDLCSLTSQSLPVLLTAAVPESTEDVLLKGFAALGMEDERIETAQQVQTQMDQDEGAKYRQMRDYLSGFQEQCDAILNDVNSALQHLESLQKQYLFVSTKTGTLHEACEQLLKEQSELVDLAENIQQKLSYFNELENINTKLNSPTLSVNSEGFIPMLAKLDDCIAYISSHPNFKDYPVYLTKFKQCLSKAMHLIKTYTVNTLQNLTTQLMKRDPSAVPNSDNAFTLFYVKFRAAAPKVRTLIEQVEQRSEKMPEYQQVLNEIHQCYLDQRELLLGPSIASTVTELTSQNNRDHCALVRSGCAFMVHVCQDEHQLYNEFFTKPTPKLDELLEKLCLSLYDVLRPMIIHVIHLETLSELCGILKNEMLEDHVQNNAEQLGAFAAGVKQMLEDVQERLVYRTHIYIQTDITGYKPAPGDLAYPDKLEMMEQIAQSLKEEQKKLPSEASFSDVRLEDPESCSLVKSGSAESLNPRHQSTISPADLHGMWYPTVRRTLVCLSKLYRCIDRAVFQGLSQEALSACIQSLLGAADSISKNKTQVDGQLFLIKHLLILREQIAPFHTDFTIKEISLDLKKTRDAAFKILNPKAVSRFFRLNSNNALIQFLLEVMWSLIVLRKIGSFKCVGTPEIREHYIDSKKDVDRHLKSACEQFIQQQTKQFIDQLEEFMTKAAALKTMATQGGPNYSLSQQPWAQPAKINDLVSSTYKTIKTKLPSTLRSMSLYLSNKDTELILFKPVRNNIQQMFQKLHALLKEEFSNEDLQIIACPSIEQDHLPYKRKCVGNHVVIDGKQVLWRIPSVFQIFEVNLLLSMSKSDGGVTLSTVGVWSLHSLCALEKVLTDQGSTQTALGQLVEGLEEQSVYTASLLNEHLFKHVQFQIFTFTNSSLGAVAENTSVTVFDDCSCLLTHRLIYQSFSLPCGALLALGGVKNIMQKLVVDPALSTNAVFSHSCAFSSPLSPKSKQICGASQVFYIKDLNSTKRKKNQLVPFSGGQPRRYAIGIAISWSLESQETPCVPSLGVPLIPVPRLLSAIPSAPAQVSLAESQIKRVGHTWHS